MLSENKDIFDELRNMVGCDFISDLLFDKYRPRVIAAVSASDASEYPPAQWNSLVQYFSGEITNLNNSEELKKYLLEKVL